MPDKRELLAAIPGGHQFFDVDQLGGIVARVTGIAVILPIVLHGLAAIGGAIGGWLGLLLLHHKTRHPIFPVVLAIALIVQLAIGFVIGW